MLVDEASMLSLPLAAALMDALPPRCQLVLVGDADQLPPVGKPSLWPPAVPACCCAGLLRAPTAGQLAHATSPAPPPLPPSPSRPRAGPGAVLQSLIASRLVPVVDLREVFRQAAQSAIVTSALAGGLGGLWTSD